MGAARETRGATTKVAKRTNSGASSRFISQDL
jgi:hypothetical protein